MCTTSPCPAAHTDHRTRRRWRRRATALLVTGLLLVPSAVWAAAGFVDVPASSPFREDIAWLKDAGVTRGCNPPANDRFCPTAPVTRQQMAAFLHRLADNRVVDAGAVGGVEADRVMASALGRLGYVWACRESQASYDPVALCEYGHSSSGGDITITRSAVGAYRVRFEGLGDPDPDRYGGHVQVSAYGAEPTICTVAGWTHEVDVVVSVRCFDLDGDPVDADYDVQFVW